MITVSSLLLRQLQLQDRCWGGEAGGDEKSEFDVILKAAGGSKLAVVKLSKRT